MKIIFGVILVAVLSLGGVILLKLGQSGGGDSGVSQPSRDNVSMVDGKQIVTLRAKGGYTPKVSIVKAGVPTILRVDTTGTFDCSSALRIPSLNVAENLPATGSTDIALGTLSAGIISGNCGMGMYPFQINVESSGE